MNLEEEVVSLKLELETLKKQYRQELNILQRQMLSLRRQQQQQDEWLDTVNSHWVKRIYWVIKGYRYHRLGRWYYKDRQWGS